MASVRAESPRCSCATRPAWSRAGPASTRSPTRSCRSTSSRWACSTAWRSSPTSRTAPDRCDPAVGRRGDVPRDRVRRPHRGDAARRRRLRLAEPRSSTASRASSTGAVVGGVAAYLVARAVGLGQHDRARAGVGGVVVGGAIGWLAWRDRLRARGHRLVVHPRPLGADLRRDPQASSSSSRSRPCSGRPTASSFFGTPERHPDRVDHRHRPDLGPRRPRDGRLRPDPALVPVRRADRLRDHGRPDAHLVAGRLQGGVRSRDVVACSASRTPTTRPSPTPPPTTPSRSLDPLALGDDSGRDADGDARC